MWKGIFDCKWKSRQLKLLFYSTVSIWAFFAIIVAFYDLQISLTLVDFNSQWAEAIASYGEIPGYLLISISLTLILGEVLTKTKWVRNPLFWIVFFFNIVVTLLLLSDLIPESLAEAIGEEFLILIYMFGQILIIKLSSNTQILSERKILKFSRITFYLALISPLILVQSIKQLWGRVRFRDLATNYTNFTPWFQPQGITGNYSFPSGHTAMGWMLLPVLVLIANKKGWHYKLIGVVVIIWGVIVGLGRIVIGAHYASDVVFSTGIAVTTFLLLYNNSLKEAEIKKS